MGKTLMWPECDVPGEGMEALWAPLPQDLALHTSSIWFS